LSFKQLKLRIKKNEGYSNKPYKDQLGFNTIGYGHLIHKKEQKYFNKTFEKKHFEKLFNKDFDKALKDYKKMFKGKKHQKHEKELLIEMIYQLGSVGLSKFRKMIFYLNTKKKYMVCLEMMDSLWYNQTPRRVKDLIKSFIKN